MCQLHPYFCSVHRYRSQEQFLAILGVFESNVNHSGIYENNFGPLCNPLGTFCPFSWSLKPLFRHIHDFWSRLGLIFMPKICKLCPSLLSTSTNVHYLEIWPCLFCMHEKTLHCVMDEDVYWPISMRFFQGLFFDIKEVCVSLVSIVTWLCFLLSVCCR